MFGMVGVLRMSRMLGLRITGVSAFAVAFHLQASFAVANKFIITNMSRKPAFFFVKIFVRANLKFQKSTAEGSMATVGERIKAVREERGWTQEKLADEAKISKGFLSEVENKGKNLGLEILLRIATALGASIEYLATGSGPEAVAREPVVIPRELSKAAEDLQLSYQETLELLDAYNSVVARRSNRKREFSADDWKELYRAIKNVIKKVYG